MKLNTMIALLITLVAFPLPSSGQSVKFKVLHNFGSSNDGNVPSGPLLPDAHGNLYGGTGGGPGLSGFGVVFALTPRNSGGWNETILHTFAETDGSPWGGLIFGEGGSLFGTTIGGPASKSEAYQLIPGSSGWSFNVLYSDGAGPGMVFDKSGNLYGSIGLGDYFGAGAIGELSPTSSGWTYTQLYSFCGGGDCSGGYAPLGPPIWDAHGNLWGTMAFGGITQSPCVFVDGCGVLYEMTPNGDGTWTYNVIHQFASSSTDGQFPGGGLVMDASGNFYGGTTEGGTSNLGTIFKFSNVDGTWQEKIIYEFSSCKLGCGVEGTMARDKSGNLYGTANGGPGNCGLSCGVVFKLAPQANGSWKYTVLYNLTKATGGVQLYGVILDGNGNLFGVTGSSGKYGAGTAFEITP